MTQEELKTCLGQLLLDLRGNWAYDYYPRLNKARKLCGLIEEETSLLESVIASEMQGNYDGRVFKNKDYYGYSSEEGKTDDVRLWLYENLTHPEYCPVLESFNL